MHRALASAPPGSVLVCGADGDNSHGYFGELMATDALERGITGLVIDGAIRDSSVLALLEFPVFRRGFAARACTKAGAAQTCEAVTADGLPVARGDVVVADPDGVAFVHADLLARVEAAVQTLQEQERELKKAVASGQ